MNKDQLEKMSDFEINLEIAKYIFGEENAVFAVILPDNPMVEVVIPNAGRVLHVDYCNNWSDMGPLTHINMITIKYHCALHGGKAVAVGFCESGRYECSHKNPLRAAAIVYLLMQEK